MGEFNSYMQTDCSMLKFCNTTPVNAQNPIAYFCMEYGIDECLPIYSGGLGILAGDYLKGMSDLHLPLVAKGLFYKQGYFLQQVRQSYKHSKHFHIQLGQNLAESPDSPFNCLVIFSC